jgi:hypothetical protein
MSLKRRSFLLGTLSTYIIRLRLVQGKQLGIHKWSYSGCCLLNGEEEEFDPDDSDFQVSNFDGPMIRSSGDRDLDRSIGVSLTRISDLFTVVAGFGFINDAGAPNAYASPQSRVPGTDGTVFLGLTLLKQLQKKAPSGVAVMGVLAHEFGHIVQFKSGTHQRLSAGKTTVRLVELHADFLTGYFAGKRGKVNPQLDRQALGNAFNAIGDTAINHPKHHGTPQERVFALSKGFRFGYDQDKDIQSAIKTGIEVVSKM